jgi:hypothetical protein
MVGQEAVKDDLLELLPVLAEGAHQGNFNLLCFVFHRISSARGGCQRHKEGIDIELLDALSRQEPH